MSHIPADTVERINQERERLLALSTDSPEMDSVVAAWTSLVSEVIVHLEAEYASGSDVSRRSFLDWIGDWSDLYVSAEELELVKSKAEAIRLDL